jgi:hypothetical protein
MMRLLFAAGIWVVLFVTSLFAQTFGEVTGHISDATGASIPGAKILLTNTATNAVRETVSTDSGDDTFAAVAPGVYNIRVEQKSFRTTSSNQVPVQVQQTVRLDFRLEVGAVNESVETCV